MVHKVSLFVRLVDTVRNVTALVHLLPCRAVRVPGGRGTSGEIPPEGEKPLQQAPSVAVPQLYGVECPQQQNPWVLTYAKG